MVIFSKYFFCLFNITLNNTYIIYVLLHNKIHFESNSPLKKDDKMEESCHWLLQKGSNQWKGAVEHPSPERFLHSVVDTTNRRKVQRDVKHPHNIAAIGNITQDTAATTKTNKRQQESRINKQVKKNLWLTCHSSEDIKFIRGLNKKMLVWYYIDKKKKYRKPYKTSMRHFSHETKLRRVFVWWIATRHTSKIP